MYALWTSNFSATVFEMLGNIKKMWILYALWTSNFAAKVFEMLGNIKKNKTLHPRWTTNFVAKAVPERSFNRAGSGHVQR